LVHLLHTRVAHVAVDDPIFRLLHLAVQLLHLLIVLVHHGIRLVDLTLHVGIQVLRLASLNQQQRSKRGGGVCSGNEASRSGPIGSKMAQKLRRNGSLLMKVNAFVRWLAPTG